jgi:cytochrome c2
MSTEMMTSKGIDGSGPMLYISRSAKATDDMEKGKEYLNQCQSCAVSSTEEAIRKLAVLKGGVKG